MLTLLSTLVIPLLAPKRLDANPAALFKNPFNAVIKESASSLDVAFNVFSISYILPCCFDEPTLDLEWNKRISDT